MLDFLWKAYQVWRGKSYIRFARYCVVIGAGLFAGPKAWQFIVVAGIQVLQLVYGKKGGDINVPLPDIGVAGQLLGFGLCIVGVSIFCYFYKLEVRALEADQTASWISLETLWNGRRDLFVPPEQVNLDDLAWAIHAVKLSGVILRDTQSLFPKFRERYGVDYLTLYKKLKEHQFKLPNYDETSDQLLNDEAHNLARKMETK